MNLEQTTSIAKQHMIGRKVAIHEPGYINHHARRTAAIALHLPDQLDTPVDPLVVHTAALFHDIGKDSDPHNEVGARIARDLLAQCCSSNELDRIYQIIHDHP